MPQLLDEIIGEIFIHLGPKHSGLCEWKTIDDKTLRTCCLVSHRFAFWARHILYKRIHIRKPEVATSYLSLFRRQADMPIHVKTIEVTLMPPLWREGDTVTESGFDDLATLLDVLREEGFVDRCHFRFVLPWDRVNTNLQISLHRFLFSHSFETIELGGICTCFLEIWTTPFPWLSKRFNLLRIDFGLGEEDGEIYLSCPQWEQDRKGLALKKGRAKYGRVLKKELRDTYDSAVERLVTNGVIHEGRTKLESLWVPAQAAGIFEAFLARPETGVCIGKLRELLFSNVNDDNIPDITRFMKACKDTIESLYLSKISVKSATSSHLSALASIPLPHLQTMTITIHLDSPGYMKSVAWYLLHAKRNRQLRFKNLNLLFVDFPNPSTQLIDLVAGSIRTVTLIGQIFEGFKFFKFEKLLCDVLASEYPSKMGKVALWFLLSNLPGALEDVHIEENMRREFPNLFREERIQSRLGDSGEVFSLQDALSIHPEGLAETIYDSSGQRVANTDLKERVLRPVYNELTEMVRQQFGAA